MTGEIHGYYEVLIELVRKHECTKVKLLDTKLEVCFFLAGPKTDLCQEMDNGENGLPYDPLSG